MVLSNWLRITKSSATSPSVVSPANCASPSQTTHTSETAKTKRRSSFFSKMMQYTSLTFLMKSALTCPMACGVARRMWLDKLQSSGTTFGQALPPIIKRAQKISDASMSVMVLRVLICASSCDENSTAKIVTRCNDCYWEWVRETCKTYFLPFL